MSKKRGYYNVMGPGSFHTRAGKSVDRQIDLIDEIIDWILGRGEPEEPEPEQVKAKYYAKTAERTNKLDEIIDYILGINRGPKEEQKDEINLLQGNDETFKKT